MLDDAGDPLVSASFDDGRFGSPVNSTATSQVSCLTNFGGGKFEILEIRTDPLASPGNIAG